jgi:hypothetical protein
MYDPSSGLREGEDAVALHADGYLAGFSRMLLYHRG